MQNLELPYDEFVDAASHLCDTCWQVEVGKPVKDINGILDVDGEARRNAAQFRQYLKPQTGDLDTTRLSSKRNCHECHITTA